MTLWQRLKFVYKYDIEQDFIVYSIPELTSMTFTKYEDAKKFSDNQLQYLPKILVSIRKVK